jgi:phytol kinase
LILPAADSWWLHQLLGAAAVLLWLVLLALASLQLPRLGSYQGEWSRKLVHIGAGAVVPIAWVCGIDRLVAIPAAVLITLAAAVNHRRRLLPAIEDVGRDSYGTVAYGASITLLLLLWWPVRADAVCAGVLVMALGDGLAGLVGARLTSASWMLLGQRRSLAGTGTMGLVSLAVLLALAAVLGVSPPPSSLLAMAAAATLLEQIGLGGLDNLSVPLAIGWLWQRLVG